MYKKALFIFRRDLRVNDNSALIQAARGAAQVVPCFIFDPRQVETHPYFSLKALQFMRQSLAELADEIAKLGGKLHFYYGQVDQVVDQLIRTHEIDALFFNRDYSPFSRSRDQTLTQLCKKLGVAIHHYGGALLHEPEQVLKDDGKPYTVFTPFFKRALKLEIPLPQEPLQINWASIGSELSLSEIDSRIFPRATGNIAIKPGRSHALMTLANMNSFKNYTTVRDIPAARETTLLSAHHKFGTISIRETYHAVRNAHGAEHALIRELYWRDFFSHIAFHFPHVFSGPFHKRFKDIVWENNEQYFEAWCKGMTGFPIVDAGMRELTQTGFMHNRVRMIVASFLCKDLLIDWRWGERFFATQLLDYDPAVNNGNWQWASSTGCDAQPYFRIFNPWLQAKKFDAAAEYIKRWVPELSPVAASDIHDPIRLSSIGLKNYPTPIVDHAEQKRRAQRLYSEL